MDRRNFVKTAGACTLCVAKSSLFIGSARKVIANEKYEVTNDGQVVLDITVFNESNDKNVLIEHPDKKYPISLLNLGDNQFSALSMKCPHQKGTTEWVDDHYLCPSHGARFTKTGEVIRGPTSKNLTSYPVTVNEGKIYIQL